MAGWSTDFTWTVDGLTNAPVRCVIDLYKATKERGASMYGTSANLKINRPRDYVKFVDDGIQLLPTQSRAAIILAPDRQPGHQET